MVFYEGGNICDTLAPRGLATVRPVTPAAALLRCCASQPVADNYALATDKRTNRRTDGLNTIVVISCLFS